MHYKSEYASIRRMRKKSQLVLNLKNDQNPQISQKSRKLA